MLCCVGKKGSDVLESMMTTTSWEVGGLASRAVKAAGTPPVRGMKCQGHGNALDVSGTDDLESHDHRCGVRTKLVFPCFFLATRRGGPTAPVGAEEDFRPVRLK